MVTFYCSNCSWQGEEDELVDNTDDGKFDQCPRCGSTALIEQEE